MDLVGGKNRLMKMRIPRIFHHLVRSFIIGGGGVNLLVLNDLESNLKLKNWGHIY